MAVKETPTFDQVYKTAIKNKLLELNNNENNFNVFNDVNEFQKANEIGDGTTYVLIKTYGGQKTQIGTTEATSLSTRILVNTTEQQKWKRILTKLVSDTNSIWSSIAFTETDDYEGITYYYFQNLNDPFGLSQVVQSSTATRYTIDCVGNILYSQTSIAPTFKVEVFIDDEFVEIEKVVTASFNLTNTLEGQQVLGTYLTPKQEIVSTLRSQCLFIAYDSTLESHNLFIDAFFTNGDELETLQIKTSMNGTDYSRTENYLIQNVVLPYKYGDMLILQVTLVSAGN